jgi:CxxC motif-containing protein
MDDFKFDLTAEELSNIFEDFDKQIDKLKPDSNWSYKKDKEILMAAVKNDGRVLKYASAELRNDKELVMVAVKNDHGCFGENAYEYASSELKKDKEVVMAAVKNRASILEYVNSELKNDKEVVMAAVKNSGSAIQYASEALKNDKEVVMTAVMDVNLPYGMDAFEHASSELKNDKDFVLNFLNTINIRESLGSSGLCYMEDWDKEKLKKNLNTKLLNDKEIISILLFGGIISIDECDEKIKYDEKMIELSRIAKFATVVRATERDNAIANMVNLIQNSRFKEDREFVLLLVSAYGEAIKYINSKFKNDREIVLAAVKNRPNVLEYLD